MPTRDEHLYKARKNKEFVGSLKLDNPTHIGWALTALFYSALHYIDAYNAKYHHHCRNHQELHDSVVRNGVLEAISDDYSDLLNFSWNARYQAVQYGKKELEEARQCHAAIEKHITDLIANGQ